MRRRGRGIALAAALLWPLAGCGRGAPPEPGRGEAVEPPEGTRVRVEFRLPGDDLGAADDRADLEAIAAAIRARGAGDLVGSEFGMGRMAAVVEVRGAAPLAAIRGAVAEVRPGASFTLRVEAPP